ncbi:unnamed protein product [Didymodactylos carnosus]|uniref:Uncharacterized protein n=1 Tax=Didymodactylos carnosus TaxID=1234261 RepID=A0A814NX71_9BILA|nr:unnamed protein product [Didymodactylos carnosus]CAF3862260.1 unnamed protein product [Didymodactylos carnosus]
MSSKHCLKKQRESRRNRLAIFKSTNVCLTDFDRDNRALFEAVNNQEYDKVLDLLQKGIDPCIADEHQRTPIHIASTKKNSAIVKILIDFGADIDAQDSLSNTPLHLACVTGRLDVASILLKSGANVFALDNSGITPMSLALSRLQIIMKDRVISSNTAKGEIIQLIIMLKEYLPRRNQSIADVSSLCEQLEKLNEPSREEVDAISNILLEKLQM